MPEPEKSPDQSPPAQPLSPASSDPSRLENERLNETIRLRHAQLKASEEELNQTRRLLTDTQTKLAEAELELERSRTLQQMQSGGHSAGADQNGILLAEIQTDLIVKADPSGQILYASPSFCEAFGKEEAELVGRKFAPSIHEDDREMTRAAEEDLERHPYECYYEHRTMTRSGWRWIAWSKKAVQAADGATTAIVAIGRDVTSRKRAEEALMEQQDGVIRFLNMLADAVAILKPSGGFLYANPAWLNRFKFTESDLAGGNIRQMIPSDNAAEIDRLFAQAFKEGLAGHALTMLTGEGSTIPADSNLTVGVWGGDTVVFWVAGAEAVAGAAKSAPSEALLEEKMAAVRRLAGGVAHSLNNMLTVVGGHIQMLTPAIEPSGPAAHDLEMIKKNFQKGTALARQLLAIAGRQKEAADDLDLGQALWDAEPLLRRLLGDAIELQLHTAPDAPPVRMNRDLFQRIIVDMADNARDAMPHGGKLSIEVGLAEPVPGSSGWRHRAVSISVADSGSGVSADAMKHLFEPYFTTKSGERASGLGLAAIHGAIHQAAGRIFVDSEPGKGTRFVLLLPAVADRAASAEKPSEESLEEGPVILIAEDEDAVRHMAAGLLKPHGYRILEARDGRDALTICERLEHPIDLLLADIVMPNVDGTELAGRLLKKWPGVKVLFMSGYSEGVKDTSIPGGADAPFLQKPFRPEELVKKVNEIIRGS